jgi:hypothetical protein
MLAGLATVKSLIGDNTYRVHNIQGVSGGTVNILGGGSMDCSE